MCCLACATDPAAQGRRMSIAGKCVLMMVLVAWLAACAPSGPSTATPAPDAYGTGMGTAAVARGVQPTTPLPSDAAALRRRADLAVQEGRLTSPAGDNAAELLDALRRLHGPSPGIDNALLELQPYLVLAAERALTAGDPVETGRLLALLAGVDDQAPALPRLQAGLSTLESRLAARTAAAESRMQVALETAIAAPVAAPASKDEATPTPVPTHDTGRSPPRNDDAVLAAASSPQAATTAVAPPSVPQTPPDRPAPARAEPRDTANAPRLLRDAAPAYPLHALRRALEGQVEVAFTVLPDGSVADATVVASQPSGTFDQAALAAARQWRFESVAEPTTSSRVLHFVLPRG